MAGIGLLFSLSIIPLINGLKLDIIRLTQKETKLTNASQHAAQTKGFIESAEKSRKQQVQIRLLTFGADGDVSLCNSLEMPTEKKARELVAAGKYRPNYDTVGLLGDPQYSKGNVKTLQMNGLAGYFPHLREDKFFELPSKQYKPLEKDPINGMTKSLGEEIKSCLKPLDAKTDKPRSEALSKEASKILEEHLTTKLQTREQREAQKNLDEVKAKIPKVDADVTKAEGELKTANEAAEKTPANKRIDRVDLTTNAFREIMEAISKARPAGQSQAYIDDNKFKELQEIVSRHISGVVSELKEDGPPLSRKIEIPPENSPEFQYYLEQIHPEVSFQAMYSGLSDGPTIDDIFNPHYVISAGAIIPGTYNPVDGSFKMRQPGLDEKGNRLGSGEMLAWISQAKEIVETWLVKINDLQTFFGQERATKQALMQEMMTMQREFQGYAKEEIAAIKNPFSGGGGYG